MLVHCTGNIQDAYNACGKAFLNEQYLLGMNTGADATS